MEKKKLAVVNEWASRKESEGRNLADGWKLYANSIIKCYAQSELDWTLQLHFPFETYYPTKEHEGICYSKGAFYFSFWGLRQPIQIAAGRNFSTKLKSKNLTAGDNSQRFQKGTMESEDNYQKSNYQVGGIEQKGGIPLRAKRDTYKPTTINSGLYITVDGKYPKELCLGLGLELLIYF